MNFYDINYKNSFKRKNIECLSIMPVIAYDMKAWGEIRGSSLRTPITNPAILPSFPHLS